MKTTTDPGGLARPRRGFLKETLALLVGGVVGLVPLAAGVLVWLDPVRRKARSPGATLLRVGTLDSLPSDGVPRRFSVVAEKSDAWTRIPQTTVGAIYLRRVADGTPEGKITALNVICPHAGCFVDYQPSREGYFCPCHNSTFGVDGRINTPSSPSPRGMDELLVEIRGREVWVEFQNFHTGRHDKVKLA